MEQKSKTLCVVIDTNIWKKNTNILLKTPLGAALLYYIKQKNGCIGLPEVIENEVIKHTIKDGYKAVENINKNFKIIEIIMGERSDYEVPDETAIKESIESRMKEIEPLIKRVPFTLEHAKSALKRVDEGTPPNGEKNQQFKDSAIWEAILSLLRENYEVHFVTEDKGFFKNRNDNCGRLAENLEEDCKNLGQKVFIYKDLKSCLYKLKAGIPELDKTSILLGIDQEINSNLSQDLLSETGFEITEFYQNKSSISAFYTEVINKLALEFELKYHLSDFQNIEENERHNSILTVEGECMYDYTEKNLSEIILRRETVNWLYADGTPGRRGEVSLRGTCVIGGRNEEIKYKFREDFGSKFKQ